MRIDRLELENWMSYPRRWPDMEGLSGSTEIVPTIELTTESLTLVAGENGAGKSAILEAICYALFAKYPRGDKNADAIRSGEKEAQVKLYFSLPTDKDNTQYCVERLLKSNSANATLKQITNDGSETVVETRQAPVTNYIEKLLQGATYDAFVSTVFLRQEEAGKFMNLGANQQRKQLLMLCRLEIYEQIYRKAKTLREQYDRKVTDSEIRFEEVKYATEDYLVSHREKTEQLREGQTELRRQEKAATEQLKAVRQVSTLRDEILKLQQTREEWEAILKQADQIRYATKWIAAWDRVRYTLAEALKTHERIVDRNGKIEQSAAELEDANETVDNLTKPHGDLEGQYSTVTQTLNALRDELPTLIEEEQTTKNIFHETKEAKTLDEQITRLEDEQSERQKQLANFETVKQDHQYAALLKQSQTALNYTLNKLSDAQIELDTATAEDVGANQADQAVDKLRQTLPDKQTSLTFTFW
ncbi:SMC family ATPase [Chloroflexi bacterium TSY]|nr:SMC family ATPase [Chloroflexi bacterium TSY]